MPSVNPKLTANIRHAKGQTKESPWWFAFVAKGTTDGMLLVGKAKIPTHEVSEAQAACKSKEVFRGRCFGEGDHLICEIGKEPPVTLDKQVKSIIHRDADLQLTVVFRVAHDLAEDEEGGGHPPP